MAKLTVVAIRNAAPREKLYRLADGSGLHVEVMPNGAKYWRLRYRYPAGGKEKMLGLGVFPDVTLAEAREAAGVARRTLANGIDPSAQRKVEKVTRGLATENTLEAITREWLELKRPDWAETYAEKVVLRFENDVFPWLGSRPIGDVAAPEILGMLKRVIERGTRDTAHRIRRTLSQVFRYAISTSRAERDPAADLKGSLPGLIKRKYPSIKDPERLGELLRAIAVYSGTYVVRAALQIAPRVFTRPGELRFAEWSEFDLVKAEWRVPGARLKGLTIHKDSAEPLIVPLATQVVEMLKELRSLTGKARYVFPGALSAKRPMSENTINAAFARMGFKGEIVGHGLRHTASTALNELRWDGDAIERQLAHKDKDAIRDIYNDAQYMAERRMMMQAWSDYLDGLRDAVHIDHQQAAA